MYNNLYIDVFCRLQTCIIPIINYINYKDFSMYPPASTYKVTFKFHFNTLF